MNSLEFGVIKRFGFGFKMALIRGAPILSIIICFLYFDAEYFGRLSLLILSIATASLLSDAGMDSAATWILSGTKDESERELEFASFLKIRIISSIAIGLALIIPTLNALSVEGVDYWILFYSSLAACILLGFCSAHRISIRVNEGSKSEVRFYFNEKISSFLVFVFLMILLEILGGFELYCYPVSIILGCGFCLLVSKVRISIPRGHVNLGILRKSAPFILSAICASIAWRFPVYYLSHNAGMEEVGYMNISVYPITFISSISAISAPLLFVNKDVNNISLRSIFSLWLFSFFVFSALFFFSENFGGNYFFSFFSRDVVICFSVLCLSIAPTLINPQLTSMVRVKFGAWAPAPISLFMAFSSLFLCLFFIPNYGYVGAAISIVMAETVAMIFLILISRNGRWS